MNTQEKIRYFTENLNLKFAKNNIGKMINLSNDMKRYLKKEYASRADKLIIQWTSQDCRSYVTALEKTLRKVNKYIRHMETKDRLINRIEKLKPLVLAETDEKKKIKLRQRSYDEENQNLAEYIRLGLQLQQLYSLYNFLAYTTYIFECILKENEKEKAKEKAKDDEYFRQELEFVFFEIMKSEV